MSLRRRAVTAALLGALGVVIATVIVLSQFTATYATSSAIRARITPAADAVEALVLAQVSASASLSDYVLLDRDASRADYERQIERAEVLIDQIILKLDAAPEIRPLAEKSLEAQEAWAAADGTPVLAAMDSGDEARARAITDSKAAWASYGAMTQATQDLQDAVDERRLAASDTLVDFLRVLGAMLLLSGLLVLALLLAYYLGLRRWVLDPLTRIRADLQQAADEPGHLHPIAPTGPPELESVALDAEALRRGLVREIDEAREARSGLAQDAPVADSLRSAMAPHSVDLPSGLRLSGRMSSAEGVIAGDWWDVVTCPGGRIAVVIGDVAGHGAPAGVMALQVRTLLHSALASGAQPDGALRLAHQALRGSRTFATALVLLIDQAAREIRWANAGHHPALLVGSDGITTALDTTGPLISALDAEWTSLQTTTRVGDALVGFTDGLIEGTTRAGEMLETADLLETLLAIPSEIRREPDETLERVLAAMREQATEWTRDDVTLVAIAFTE
ncbi:MAG: PP2C family protein-serine/threonine phosphatase [Actinomycetes bacterium]